MSETDRPSEGEKQRAREIAARVQYLRVHGLGIESFDAFYDRLTTGLSPEESEQFPSRLQAEQFEVDQEPPPLYIGRIVEVFGVTWQWLVRGTGDVTLVREKPPQSPPADDGDEMQRDRVVEVIAGEFPSYHRVSPLIQNALHEAVVRRIDEEFGQDETPTRNAYLQAALDIGKVLQFPVSRLRPGGRIDDWVQVEAYVLALCQAILTILPTEEQSEEIRQRRKDPQWESTGPDQFRGRDSAYGNT